MELVTSLLHIASWTFAAGEVIQSVAPFLLLAVFQEMLNSIACLLRTVTWHCP